MKTKVLIAVILGIILAFGGVFWWQRKAKILSSISISNLNSIENRVSVANEGKDDSAKSDKQSMELKQSASDEAESSQLPPVELKKEKETAAVQQQQPSESSNDSSTVVELVNWGFKTGRTASIDSVIVHSSYDAVGNDPCSVSGVIAEYKDYGVAPHYLIDRSGKIHQLVAEKNTAYHAGKGELPNGATNINERSLGIELLGTESSGFSTAEYSALNSLIAKIKAKYAIKYILGHNDIAPGRKTDPWKIDWSKVKR